MKKIFNNFFKKKTKIKEEHYKNIVLPKIEKYYRTLKNENSISFLHYGHLGDIINSLPVIKEISKSKNCNLYIQVDKEIPSHIDIKDHLLES